MQTSENVCEKSISYNLCSIDYLHRNKSFLKHVNLLDPWFRDLIVHANACRSGTRDKHFRSTLCAFDIREDVYGDAHVSDALPTRDETFSGILHLSFYGLWLFAHAVSGAHVFVSCRRRFIGKSIARKVNYSIRSGETHEARRSEGRETRQERARRRADIETGTTRLHALREDWRAGIAEKRRLVYPYNKPRECIACIYNLRKTWQNLFRIPDGFAASRAKLMALNLEPFKALYASREEFYLKTVFVQRIFHFLSWLRAYAIHWCNERRVSGSILFAVSHKKLHSSAFCSIAGTFNQRRSFI